MVDINNTRILLCQSLADGLRTGETELMEPLDSTSAVNLTKAFLEGISSVKSLHGNWDLMHTGR